MPVRRVLGVDACRGGWVGIAITVAGPGHARGYLRPGIEELVTAVAADEWPEVVAIDIPIGLADSGTRRADELARARLGRRASSVFSTPVRAAVTAGDHATAVRIHRAATGAGVSVQGYGLRHRILEVDAWVRRGAPLRVVEAHPEVCFAELARRAGTGLPESKKTWAGAARRRALLTGAGVGVPDELGAAGAAAVDDVLDAAATAWTARRVALGQASCLPAEPEVFTDGLRCAIWV